LAVGLLIYPCELVLEFQSTTILRLTLLISPIIIIGIFQILLISTIQKTSSVNNNLNKYICYLEINESHHLLSQYAFKMFIPALFVLHIESNIQALPS
jgi:hypothetical protein